MVRRIAVIGVRFGAALALALLLGAAAPGRADDAPAAHPDIAGRWTGSKLRCQKEEGKLVRCGTPSPFAVTFAADGKGTCPDELFPREFTWSWVSPTEIAVSAPGLKEPFKLFGFEREDTMMTFQAYVFLPTSDPNLPAEARYLHYVFDLNRAE
jgi:hypothetical protein